MKTGEQFLRVMKHLFLKGLRATDTIKELQDVYGDEAPSPNTVFRWFKKFKNGDLSLKVNASPGRPKLHDPTELIEFVNDCPSVSSRQLARMFNMNHKTVIKFLKQAGKSWRYGRIVPHKLSDAQRMNRISCCMELLEFEKREDLLRNLITCDETWILYDNYTPHKQWLSPNQESVMVAKNTMTVNKVLLCIWWDSKGLIFFEMLNPGETINSDIYQEQLYAVQECLSEKRPALVNRRQVFFLQDNAPAHRSGSTHACLTRMHWKVLCHPAYSPDLSPSDYFLFRNLKRFLHKKIYKSRKDIEIDIEDYFSSRTDGYFKKPMYDLPNRWQKVVESNGDYCLN